jgi:hypothetical protein
MSKHQVGKLIAIQDEDGHVYTGIVTSVDVHDGTNDYNVDVLADGVYHRQELSKP